MKYYELTYLPATNLTADEKNSLSERVISCLPTPPIKQESSASFLSLDFYAEPEKIQEIEKKLKGESQIKRLMIIVKKIQKPESRLPRRRRLAARPAEEKLKKKVELKEIEKKLDEILKE